MNQGFASPRRTRRLIALCSALLVAFAWTAAAANATTIPPYVLSVVAGTGATGAATPGPATSSKLVNPSDIVFDKAGNWYVADTFGHEVYKINAAGTLSIYAGTGTNGAATPGLATASNLGSPRFISLDGWGNLYIADYTNQQVFMVAPNGVLSVFAGTGSTGAPVAGPAVNSPLTNPSGIAATSSGTVYLSTGNQVVRITKSGVLSNFAGSGTVGQPTNGPATSSNLNTPFGLTLDAANNV